MVAHVCVLLDKCYDVLQKARETRPDDGDTCVNWAFALATEAHAGTAPPSPGDYGRCARSVFVSPFATIVTSRGCDEAMR